VILLAQTDTMALPNTYRHHVLIVGGRVITICENKLIAPLNSEEQEFNTAKGSYTDMVNALMSMLMMQPTKALRHVCRFVNRNCATIDAVISSTLILTSSGLPDYVLSMIQLNTVRVISPPTSTSISRSTSAPVKRARVY